MLLKVKKDISINQLAYIESELENTLNTSEVTFKKGHIFIPDTVDLNCVNGIIRKYPFLEFDTDIAYKLACKNDTVRHTSIKVGNIEISKETFQIIAGPCAVECQEQILEIAKYLKEKGITILRGGAFKPRSSPYSFQGLGVKGIKLLETAKKIYGLPIITEIMDISQIDYFENVDIIQVGARNMQNYSLLNELGKTKQVILLKRGFGCTLKEFIMSAEYILKNGNPNVILCERGIRTFENSTRNTLDISAIPILKSETHLPVVVDPSHAAGRKDIIQNLSYAAIAAGADGIMIEVHNNPEIALSDGKQSLNFAEFDFLIENLKKRILFEKKCLGIKERK